MHTTTLMKCLACGNQISQNADNCPKCQFGNIRCRICDGRIGPDELLAEKNRGSKDWNYHRKCLKVLYSPPPKLSCRACLAEFPEQWVHSAFDIEKIAEEKTSKLRKMFYLSCPSYKDKNPFDDDSPCEICSQPILRRFHEVFRTDDGSAYEYCYRTRWKIAPAPANSAKQNEGHGLLWIVVAVIAIALIIFL